MKGLLATLLVTVGALANSAQAMTISVSPDTQTSPLESTVQVDLDISSVNSGMTPALAAWDLNVAVDPNVLSFSSATFGPNVDVSGLGDIQVVSPAGNGTTELYEISLDPTELLTSLQPQNFTLATLYFQAVGSGSSALNVAINSLSDGDGNLIPATVTPGSIVVAPVPLPPANLLMLSALTCALLASQITRLPQRRR